MRARRSLIWSHFENSDMNRAVCKHCSKQISFNGGSIGNLSRHIKLRHPFIISCNEVDGHITDKLQEPKDQSPESEDQLVEQPKSLKLNSLKRKYKIIDGKVASPSQPESNNLSAAFEEDMITIYEKPIEFVDNYIKECPFVSEEVNSEHVFEPKSPKIAKPENSRNKNLEDLKTREEIKLLRAKTAYFTKQLENLDIERSLMLLKVKKLELEVEKLNNEAHENPLPSEEMRFETVNTVES